MPSKPADLESQIQAQFIALLELYGVFYWRQHTQGVKFAKGRGRNPMAGFPDVCGVTKKGQFWAAEIKRPGGKVSPLQTRWIEDLTRLNAITTVIYTYEDCVSFLTRLIQK